MYFLTSSSKWKWAATENHVLCLFQTENCSLCSVAHLVNLHFTVILNGNMSRYEGRMANLKTMKSQVAAAVVTNLHKLAVLLVSGSTLSGVQTLAVWVLFHPRTEPHLQNASWVYPEKSVFHRVTLPSAKSTWLACYLSASCCRLSMRITCCSCVALLPTGVISKSYCM